MTNPLEVMLGILLSIFLLVVFSFGLSIGGSEKVKECDAFGKFLHKGAIYECKRVVEAVK